MNGHTNGTNGETPVSLPSAKPSKVSDEITVNAPLSRRGHGPGLILLVPDGLDLSGSDKTLDPPPLQKWAEEGFAVAQVSITDNGDLDSLIDTAIKALRGMKECDSVDKMGVISYNVSFTNSMVQAIDNLQDIVALINYGSSEVSSNKPQQWHLAGATAKSLSGADSKAKIFEYKDSGPFFVIPAHENFRSASAGVSHTRCLQFLKPLVGGPYFDLEAIWDEHCKYEFGERAVEQTMGTMVQEPYVNHIPTITGGIGRDRLTTFYRHHFVFSNPDDTALELVSRTVGIDRVIDEFIFSFTHDREIDWILPGVPPTGKFVRIPFTGVINIRGDRLYHEHIGWDQATLLRQLGLLPEYLPFPYPLADGRTPTEGKRFEYKVPTAGVETTKKLVDERSVESNGLFGHEIREVDA